MLCHQYTLNITCHITRSIIDLETEIVGLGNRGWIDVLKTKKMALASLLDTRVQGALVQSQIQEIMEMDATSSFFFGSERRYGQRKLIHS